MKPRVRLSGSTFLIITLFAAFLMSLAVLLPPALRAWQNDRDSTFESILKEGVPASVILAQPLDEEQFADDFLSFLERYDHAEGEDVLDPWFFSALVIGYLRLHNVPLWEPGVAALFSTQTRDTVVVQEGNSWESLAAEHVGNEQLWPLLWLLNREWVTRRGIELDVGYQIWVPLLGELVGPELEDAR